MYIIKINYIFSSYRKIYLKKCNISYIDFLIINLNTSHALTHLLTINVNS